jgi:hypothetical protein
MYACWSNFWLRSWRRQSQRVTRRLRPSPMVFQPVSSHTGHSLVVAMGFRNYIAARRESAQEQFIVTRSGNGACKVD